MPIGATVRLYHAMKGDEASVEWNMNITHLSEIMSILNVINVISWKRIIIDVVKQ